LDVEAVDTGLGVWVADLDTSVLGVTNRVDFTSYWPEAARREGVDFRIVVTS
jgi:hypothetical protein